MNTFNVYFDGGTIPTRTAEKHDWIKNPIRFRTVSKTVEIQGGCGYGSWEVIFNGFSKKVSRREFTPQNSGFYVTSNVAEYLALEDALKWLQTVKEKKLYRVTIHGDSKLVTEQMVGRFRAKNETMKQMRDNCRELLVGFGDWQCHWIPRIKNVQRFGH